jgi:hypothetical protein
MSCRRGGGLCSKAGLARLGQDALEGTKIRAPASKRTAMRDRRMKQAASARGCAAGWGHAQATPLVDDLRRAPTRADAGSPQSQHRPTGSGDAGDGSEHNLKAVHRGRGCRRVQAHTEDARPRDEDPPGTRRTYRLRTHGSALGFGQRTQARDVRQCLLRGRSLVSGVWSAAPPPC